MSAPTVDFIVPCYNEAGNVAALYEAFCNAFADSDVNWHLIMDDGDSCGSTFWR